MNRPLPIAVIGTGWWSGRHHIPSLAGCPAADLVALVDPRQERAAELAARHGVRRVFGSVDELIAAALVECVVVATPHTTHRSIALRALESGLHVFVEKPLATTAEDAFDLLLAAEANGRHLSVGYTSQYAPAASVVRDWVTGCIGPLVQVVVEFSSRAGKLYRAALADPTSSYAAGNGGGQGNTQLTHAMAALIWTTGEQVTEIAAFADRRDLPVDVDDAAIFRLTNGATGVAASTGGLGDRTPLRQHVRYLGTKGTVDHDLLAGSAVLRMDSGTERRVGADHTEPGYPADLPVRAFVELVAGRGPDLGPARPAAAATAAIEAMYRSAASRSFVPVRRLPTAPPDPAARLS